MRSPGVAFAEVDAAVLIGDSLQIQRAAYALAESAADWPVVDDEEALTESVTDLILASAARDMEAVRAINGRLQGLYAPCRGGSTAGGGAA